MNARVFSGAVAAYGYNGIVSHIPCHFIRIAYLRAYLGSVGEGTAVLMHCRFLNGRKVFLGQRNVINFGCLFDGRHFPIRIGSDVSVGPEATILTLGHDPQDPDFRDKGGEVVIEDRVWIAHRAVILPGVKIGIGAVVAAGAVVASDVEPFTIVAGSPARQIGERNRDIRYELSYKPFLL